MTIYRRVNCRRHPSLFPLVLILMLSICAAPAHASLINFDNQTTLQDVSQSYSSVGVHFTPAAFTILTQNETLTNLAISPSFPNVALLNPQAGASILFDSPLSAVSFKYGIIRGLTVTAAGPNFSQSLSDSVSSFPNINRFAVFSSPQAVITSLTFNQIIPGDTVIDDLVFSSVSGSERAKDRTIPGIKLGVSAAGVALSIAGAVAAVPSGGLSTIGLLGEFVGGVGAGMSLAGFIDPFDPNYSQKFSPVFIQLPLVRADATLPQALADEANAALNHGSRAISFMQAQNVSLNRLNSAIQVGDQASIDLQRSAVDTYLALSSSELEQYSRKIESLTADLRGMNLDIPLTLDQIMAFLADLKSRGLAALPQQEQALFDLFGFDSDFRQFVVDQFLSVDPVNVPQSLVQGLSTEASGFSDLAAVYAGPNAAPVPEPSTLSSIMLGIVVILLLGHSRHTKRDID